jgi:hypothetical protein
VPDEKQRDREVEELKGALTAAMETISRLEQKVAELEGKLDTDSTNSPPPQALSPGRGPKPFGGTSN